MKFSEDPHTPRTIRHIEPGSIRIGDDVFTGDLVLHAAGIDAARPKFELEALSIEDLAPYLASNTEIVLLGTGWNAAQPPRSLVFDLGRRGIGFESMDTPAACRTFNILCNEGRNVVAFLKLA